MSRSGQLPACVSCGSLERHRTVRAVWQPLVGAELRRLKAIQFSLDPSVNKDWFDYLEVSIYEKRNSLDLEDIYRLSGSYDIVICNHVLEHIEDDRRAFREIMRVLTPSGFFQFTVPLPWTRAVTEEWGYPDRPHGHYRLYGRDVIDRFAEARPGTRFLCVPCGDPVTGEPDFVYFAFPKEAPAERDSPSARPGVPVVDGGRARWDERFGRGPSSRKIAERVQSRSMGRIAPRRRGIASKRRLRRLWPCSISPKARERIIFGTCSPGRTSVGSTGDRSWGPSGSAVSMGALVGALGSALRHAVRGGERGLRAIPCARLHHLDADLRRHHRRLQGLHHGGRHHQARGLAALDPRVSAALAPPSSSSFHNAAVFVVVAAVFAVWPGWTGLLALPGLLLLCLNGIWAGLLLGIVSARFRDVPPIVTSVVRICFFVTPIIWMPELLPARTLVLDANPFFHLVEVVRAPLLGQMPGLASWIAVLVMTAAGWLVTFAFFRRYRRRIAYWV